MSTLTAFFSTSAKNRYQLEVPDSIRKIPDEYTLQSQKKGFKRYWTAEIEEKLAELVDAEERREEALKDTMRHVFHKFDQEWVVLSFFNPLFVSWNNYH